MSEYNDGSVHKCVKYKFAKVGVVKHLNMLNDLK